MPFSDLPNSSWLRVAVFLRRLVLPVRVRSVGRPSPITWPCWKPPLSSMSSGRLPLIARPKLSLPRKSLGLTPVLCVTIEAGQHCRQEDLGHLWEHIVLNELMAQLQRRDIHYWRDKRGHEIDFVLTRRGAEPVAIECKWSADAFQPRSLRAFRRHYPRRPEFCRSGGCQTALRPEISERSGTICQHGRCDQSSAGQGDKVEIEPQSGNLLRNDRQHNMRLKLFVMQNGLLRGLELGAGRLVAAGVQVAVEAREVTRRYLYAQTMPRQKHVAGGP